MFVLLCFAVYYAPGPFNSPFGSVRGMNRNVHFCFQGQTSLLSNESTSERNTLILGGDKHTFHIIISTAMLEGKNRIVYRKPEFIFREAAPDTDQQLLVWEGQWIYTLDEDRYYLSESKLHYPLTFFQSVMMLRVMK